MKHGNMTVVLVALAAVGVFLFFRFGLDGVISFVSSVPGFGGGKKTPDVPNGGTERPTGDGTYYPARPDSPPPPHGIGGREAPVMR